MACIKVYVLEDEDGRVDSIWLTRDAMSRRLRMLRDAAWTCRMFLARDYIPGLVTAELEYRAALESEAPPH